MQKRKSTQKQECDVDIKLESRNIILSSSEMTLKQDSVILKELTFSLKKRHTGSFKDFALNENMCLCLSHSQPPTWHEINTDTNNISIESRRPVAPESGELVVMVNYIICPGKWTSW